ncbi:hypothetical protein BLAT2472_110067 [Burkholderia latens]
MHCRYSFRSADRREIEKTGRMADYRLHRSRFKIFLTNESSYTVAITRCTFGRLNAPFTGVKTHKKRVIRI